MPIFDYKCSDCDKTYEVYHKVREMAEDVICPDCGSSNHKRLMSVPAISFAGKSNAGSSSDSSCKPGGSCCGGACEMN